MTETMAAWAPRALSVLRIIMGLMIIEHGMGKLLGWPPVAAYAGITLFSLLGLAGIIELVGGALRLPAGQWRLARHHLLLCLSLSVDRGRWPLEPRRDHEEGLRGREWTSSTSCSRPASPMFSASSASWSGFPFSSSA